MGVLSSAYLVTKEDFKQIRKRSSYADIFFWPEEMTPEKVGLTNGWKPPTFDFDKGWNDLLCILSEGGFEREASKLEYGMRTVATNHSDFSVEYISPSDLKKVSNKLAKGDVEKIREKAIANKTTDWWGEEIPEHMYDYYLGDFGAFQEFLKQGSEMKAYFVLVSG
jgi:hypothetical protein